MISPLSLMIGLRFIRGHCRSNMISLISVISITGIALGTSVLIIGLSAMNGFERELNNRILAVVPHGEIETVYQPWNDWKEALIKIKNVSGVVEASPYINFIGLVESGTNLYSVQVKGIDPKEEVNLNTLTKFVQNNAWEAFQDREHQVIIGKGVSDVLKVNQGDWISIIIANANSSSDHKLKKPKRIRLHVVGIIKINSQLDYRLAIVPINDARHYLNIGDSGITGIAITVNHVFDANKLVRDAGEAINKYAYIKSWIGTYGYIYRDIQMIRAMMYLAMILVIGVACFNIVSTMVMAVKEKSIDIAVLCTLGAKDSLISAIFVWYGLLGGLLGSLLGTVIGVVVSFQLTSILNRFENFIGYHFLPGSIYFINFLPSELHWLDVCYVLVIVLLISLLSSWYPARRANNIDPTKILNRS